jgi:competence protein ComEA
MFKKFIVALAALIAATAFAAVDVNKATQAELESIKGIGPTISTLILSERKKGAFKDWNDFTTRVKGVGDVSAGKFSEGGLTLNGAKFSGPTAGGAPIATKAASATKATASKAASATKATASKAASAVKGGAHVVAQDVRDEKAALKENVQEAKDKSAAKKADAAASAPMKK